MYTVILRNFVGSICCLATFATAVSGLDLQSKIDPLAKALIDDHLVVGMVVGIVKDGQTQVISYGETVKGSGTAPNGNTVYEIGSVSKVFTGVLLADAVEQGSVALDDPVQKLLPATVHLPVEGNTPITLEHLATQRSGLPRLPSNMGPKDIKNPYADYTVEQMYEFLGGCTLSGPPGTYAYSNLGMGLLGHVLALQAGKTYEELLIDRITKPLGMADTRITLNDAQQKRLAPPYDGALEPDKNWDLPTLAGAGAIRSTADDMLKFIQANLATDDKPVIKALRQAREKRHDIDGGLAIGLSWHFARDGFTRWHNGQTGGYAGWLSVVPDQKIGVVVLSNTATDKITQFGEQVTQIAFGIDVPPPVRSKEIDVDADTLQKYAGVYAIVPVFKLTVTVEAGKLMVQATGQQKFRVYAKSPTEFFYKVVDAQITFKSDDNGNVNELILHQNGKDMPAKREN